MDRSSSGSALGGEDLGGNEVQAVRVATRLAPQRPVAPPSPRKPLELLERQSHGARTNPSSCPARQTVSDGRGRARHRLRRAHVSIRRLQLSGSWHRASVLFAEVGARNRVALLTGSNGRPKGWAARIGKSGRRKPAHFVDETNRRWAGRRSERSLRLNVVPARTALRVVPKQGVVRLFIPTKRGMTSARVSLTRDVSSWRQVREHRLRVAVPRSRESVLTERRGPKGPARRGRSPRQAASSGVAHQR